MLKEIEDTIEETKTVFQNKDSNKKEVVETKKEEQNYDINKMIVDEIDNVVKEYKEKETEDEDLESDESVDDKSTSGVSGNSDYASEMVSVEDDNMECADEDKKKEIDESGYEDMNVEDESSENDS